MKSDRGAMNHGLRIGATLAIALFSSLAALGCPGTLADKECFAQADSARTVLVASCAYGGCHNAEDASTGLDVETPGAGQRLAGKDAITCDGKLVDPGNPDASVLYTKLSDPPPCGSRMPLAHPELAESDKEAIRKWILGLDGSCSGAAAGGAGGTGGTTTSSGGGGAGGTTTSSGGMGGAGGMTGGTAGTAGMGGM